MDDLTSTLLVCVAIPLLLSLIFLEKKSRLFVIFIIIGAYMCTFAAQVNSLLRDLSGETYLYVTTNITPISEELLKAVPVLLYALAFNDHKKALMPISMATGIGFAVIENLIIFSQNSFALDLEWAIQRAFGASLMHSLCTTVVGYGISFVRKRRKLFYTGTFAFLVAAIVYHSVYNMLIQSGISDYAFLLPLLTYIPIAVGDLRTKRRTAEKQTA